MICGSPGGFVIQPVMFLNGPILYRGTFCVKCQTKLANAERFEVVSEEGGWRITPVDTDGTPLLKRQN